MNIKECLAGMVQKGASDLHLTAGAPPTLRVDGVMVPLTSEKLTPEMTQTLVYSMLTEAQRKTFETHKELDLSFQAAEVGRVRGNIFQQKGSVSAAFRIIPEKFQTFDELGLPDVVNKIIKLPKGLVLVTGQTGSGKSTTIASMINNINENRACHIITVEDPIEFVHTHKQSLVEQREVGSDTQNFGNALKYVLRQDPDVILIGEMRDFETVQAAMTLAETGHLVFATLHTNDCATSVNRIVDVFPAHQQDQAQGQLSLVLQAVMSQVLIPKSSERGRILACEVMIATPAVRNLIREGKAEQIYLAIQTGSKDGMQTMNQSLTGLVQKRIIDRAEALNRSTNQIELEKLLAGGR